MTPLCPNRINTPESGFTLVELLVAMTLLSFLTVLLFGGLRFGSRAWERSQQSYTDEKALQAASYFLATNIMQAYPLPLHNKAGHWRIDFEGGSRTLSWLSAAPTGDGSMMRLRLYQRDGGNGPEVDIASSGELVPASTANVHRLAGGVLDVQYYGQRADEKAPRWSGDWHGQPRLPSLVRVSLLLRNPRASWQDVIVAPRLAGDAGCVLDALTNNCRGQ